MAVFRSASNTLTHALNAHQRGWSVIPLRGGDEATSGKRPAGKCSDVDFCWYTVN